MVEREGSLSLALDGRVLRFGKSLEEKLGFVAEEVYNRDFTCLFPVAKREELKGLLEAAKGPNAVTGHKTAFLRKDGSVIELYVSIYPLRNRVGELSSLMLTVSAQRPDEVPAILTEEFQRFFRFSNDGVAVTDRYGFIIDVNQAWLDTYGYERQDVLGRNPRILKSPHSTRGLYEKMWKDILDPGKGFWRGEIINLRKNGTEVPVLLSVNAIKDKDNEIRHFLGIAMNMTRQKELEKLNKMYIDYIIHDIRGPLTSIMANTELLQLQLEGKITEKGIKKLDTILNSAQKINNMTADMLDYSRAGSGVLTVKKDMSSFAKILKEAVTPFISSEKKLSVNGAPYDEGKVTDRLIDVDHDKIQRVVYNLLSNAFKHAKTSVNLDYEFVADGLKVTVSDDGKGISRENAERIFDAFYQAPDGIKSGGAGLGLSIVKNFTEAHNGRVWVEPSSRPGSGGAIGFFVPYAATNPAMPS